MFAPIKNIIFDFGGVIFNIDHNKVERAFKALGLNNFDELFSQAAQTDIFQDFEKGILSPAAFRAGLMSIAGLAVSDEVFDRTWNEILCDYPPHRIEVLKQIAGNYRLFLLSNTNIIHYKHYIGLFQDSFGYDFNTLFEDSFWSFKIGKRKPDPDPYEHILTKHKLLPEETLFIDDSMQNISSAEKLNIVAYHLDEKTDISAIFKDGLLVSEIDK